MNPKTFRKELRRNQTPAETAFWYLVRAGRFYKLKFRRQHTLGKYTVDFYCPKFKLIIELDGSVHDNLGQSLYDDERDIFLKELGFQVIRFENDAVLKYPEAVLNYLAIYLKLAEG